jgi:integrase
MRSSTTHGTLGTTALVATSNHGAAIQKNHTSEKIGDRRGAALAKQSRAIVGAGDYGPYVRPEEARAVLATLEPTSDWGTFTRFLWQSGARISEALGVRDADIDFGAGTVRVQTLKRRANADGTPKPPTFRLVPIQVDLLGFLAQRLRHFKPADDDRLWPWTREHASREIHRLMRNAGVPEERCHPHAWRHGLAVHCIKSGVNLVVVQEQLGHAEIASTMKYLKLTILDRKQALARVEF